MNRLQPELYQRIAEEAALGLVVLTYPQGEPVFVNSMAQVLLGLTAPRLKDLIPQESHPPIPSFSREILEQDNQIPEVLVGKAHSEFFIASVEVRHIHHENEDLVLLMLQDVSVQNHLRQELIEQNERLKDLDVAKNRFIALTTHELRTPIAAMFSASEILKLKLVKSQEQIDEFVEMIYQEGLHLQRLVNDILDFSRMQSGKMDYFLEFRDAREVLDSLIPNFQGFARASFVKLHFERPSIEMSCYFDDIRLRQVLSNIINNAIKYNVSNGQVTVSMKDKGEKILIFVKDTGQGIPRDRFQVVFNEFETVGQVVKHHQGSGLGMPLSRRLIQGMGGDIQLESEVGVGTTFWVEIPKQKVLDPSMYRTRPGTPGDLAA